MMLSYTTQHRGRGMEALQDMDCMEGVPWVWAHWERPLPQQVLWGECSVVSAWAWVGWRRGEGPCALFKPPPTPPCQSLPEPCLEVGVFRCTHLLSMVKVLSLRQCILATLPVGHTLATGAVGVDALMAPSIPLFPAC